MKWISSLIIGLASLLRLSASDTVNLGWDNYTNVVGVAGIRVYCGAVTNPASGQFFFFTNVPPSQVLVTMQNIPAGLTHFQATAFLTNGLESIPSNVASYTNRNFGPINLRITGSTNNTAAIWVDNTSASLQVQWSSNLLTWKGWAAVQSLDTSAPVGNAIFLAGLAPDPARYWRAISVTALTAANLPAVALPIGQRLTPIPSPILPK